MSRTTRTITFSLPIEMADRVNEVTKQEGRSRSEFLREAVLRYLDECEWRQLLVSLQAIVSHISELAQRTRSTGGTYLNCPRGLARVF